ncbi:MAG: hypothetical protein Kow0098_03220 [Ignavibacteriaceae bacterium]
MDTPRTLRDAIRISVEKGTERKTIQEIAEECGVSDSTIYRWNKDEDSTSFADLPCRRLRQFMEATGSLAVLDYFERKFNRIALSLPKAAMSRLEEGELVDDYQSSTIDAVKALRKFLSKPTQKNFEIVEDALREVMSKSMSVKKYCDKKASGQMELSL